MQLPRTGFVMPNFDNRVRVELSDVKEQITIFEIVLHNADFISDVAKAPILYPAALVNKFPHNRVKLDEPFTFSPSDTTQTLQFFIEPYGKFSDVKVDLIYSNNPIKKLFSKIKLRLQTN